MNTFECVPNLSEGRRPGVIERILLAATSVRSGARLVNRSSDGDHNRTVLTFLGNRESLSQAVCRLAHAATSEIDLRRHHGLHPRVGALDVVPFVPLGCESMAAAVAIARQTGRQIAEDCEVPVFLYGAAAPEPRTLADLRRGGWQALGRRIEAGELRPDFGGRRIHPSAGAVLVGARPLLVAFNLVLASADVEVAKTIAAAIRQSAPGGLPGVLALGLLLPSSRRAQVSVNLVDTEATSLLELVERVRIEAGRSGVEVQRSELIGLTPQSALRGATADALLLPELTPSQILETHLESG